MVDETLMEDDLDDAEAEGGDVLADDLDPLGISGGNRGGSRSGGGRDSLGWGCGIRDRGAVLLWCRTHLE